MYIFSIIYYFSTTFFSIFFYVDLLILNMRGKQFANFLEIKINNHNNLLGAKAYARSFRKTYVNFDKHLMRNRSLPLWLIDREILKGNECQFLIEFVSEISSHAVQLAVQLYAKRITGKTGKGIWNFIRKKNLRDKN